MAHRLFFVASVTFVLLHCAAADVSYTIKQGDTLSAIGSRYGVKVHSIAIANGITSETRLKLGSTLRIPQSKTSRGHLVRNGDNDRTIAKAHGINASELRKANPSVNWSKLQIGQSIRLPGNEAPSGEPLLWLAELKPPVKVEFASVPSGSYTVKQGDTDWGIANRLAITVQDLHTLNANVEFSRLKPGDVLNVIQSGHRLPKTGLLEVAELVPELDTASIGGTWAMMNADRVGIRSKPATTASRIGLVDKYTRGRVIGKNGIWYCLRFQHGTTGWVKGNLLAHSDAPAWAAPARPRYAQAHRTMRYAYHRRYRSHASGSDDGEAYAALDTGGNEVVDTAAKFRGVHYRYGSSSPSAFDCSGFTMYVYKKQGISLPHNAAAQSRKGARVGMSDIKPGDLVFFKSSRGGSRVGHAGIAIGNGKFIHASSGKGKVRVDSYESGHYKSRFAGARTFQKKKVEPKKSSDPPATQEPKTEPDTPQK
jgi:cell wall-associated NlpC family hydrolase/LysM repeat protein